MLNSWKKRQKERRFHRQLMPHSDALYHFALRLCHNEHDAEDLVQESLMKAFRALDRLPNDSNYRAWLFTILRNGWLSKVRRQGRVLFSDSPPDRPCPRPDPLGSLLTGLMGEGHDRFDDVVLRALRSLSEVQRTAVLLSDVENFPYQDIARVLGCPVGTVRSRIFHARRALRAALANYAVQEGVIDEREIALSKV